jgi:16S rRNA (cytidine1402-2'-O)-methyltransferase
MLILCATPIGNLGDAPPRLAEALATADVVYAEDTRRTRVLLDALGVTASLRSYFAGNEDRRSAELAERLGAGETLVLVTDAGMPGISDPGISAVRAAQRAGATVSVVPGPSAVTAALAVSGLPADRFVFEGFLPRSGSARRRRLDRLAAEERTTVLFAAPSRLADDLADLTAALGDERAVTVTRELTKLHEEVWQGTLGEAAQRWREVAPRGEFTLVVAGVEAFVPDLATAQRHVEDLVAEGATVSAAVRRVADDTGVSRRELYERVHGETGP